MKKDNVKYVGSFLIGSIVSTTVSALVVKHLMDNKLKEHIELEEKFRNKEFKEDYDYISNLSMYYRKKSNRAKIGKKYNDVKKFDLISKLLAEKAKTLKEKPQKHWITLG
jgi:hypothetical protein